MPEQIYINGRFLAQPLSGVQRFAIETAAALCNLVATSGDTPPVILMPPSKPGRAADDIIPELSPFVRQVGRRQGQFWEQLELPELTRDGVLINLGNTAPIRATRQLLVIHDAGVFAHPEAYSRAFRVWYFIMQSAVVRRRAKIVTVSQFSRSEIGRYLHVSVDEISVMSEGADHMKRAQPDPSVLADNELQPGRFAMVVGNLAAHKNLKSLDATAQALAVRGYDLVVTGGFNDAVFARPQRALPQPAKYVGRVSDQKLRALYESAGCFVFPSLYEGFGIPAIEAMICGCPIVVADIPAFREVCGAAAIYCDPHDSESISAATCRMLEDNALRMQMGSEMLARIPQFTWKNSAQSLLNIVRNLESPEFH